ncbi:nuclear transport factor 2 family protein [uncultured Psychroserpens sp.]|uniref:nuclear transport factor 2 family protein n=1 Tax=uncultured Psychroserpens sp. TaxID=255436 RepID=UPI00261CF004|nr:nuclear transport factor 2 family protein [uncultured Psychroserpens sp.]
MKAKQKDIVKNYVASYNNFDVDGMIKDCHHDVIFENTSNGVVDLRTEGLKAFKVQAESAKQYFKERTQTITSWMHKNTTVTIDIDYKAILALDLPNGLKAGDSLELKGQSEFEFLDGKIKKITDKS